MSLFTKAKLMNKVLYTQLLLLILFFFSTSFSFDPYSIKRISDANFRYEFYTTDKKITPKNDKVYYWFKGGLIHCAQGGAIGMLLHGSFTKMYHSNQLAEQGSFDNGLKIGLWKSWHPNGVIHVTQKWANGLKSGDYHLYDENGLELERGKFKNDHKQGVWIDFVKKDTVVYKKGKPVIKKVKISKDEKRKFKELKNKEKEAEKIAKQTKNKSSNNKEEKPNFIKRIFTKKSK